MHKELPKRAWPLAGHRMEKEGAAGEAKAAQFPESGSRCPGKGWRAPGAAPWELLLPGLGAASSAKLGGHRGPSFEENMTKRADSLH